MWFGRRHVSCQSILLLTVAVACSTAQELSYAPNRSPTILFTHNGDGLQPLSDLDIYSDVPRTNRYAYPELDQNDLGFLTPENDEYIQGKWLCVISKQDILKIFPLPFAAEFIRLISRKVLEMYAISGLLNETFSKYDASV